MKSIENRKDVNNLVCLFYDKIKTDDLLGPIFNYHIAPEAWEDHLEKLTDFWESNLFGVRKFKGRPGQKHIIVDREQNNTISVKHFEQWLALWFRTVDELYAGELAERAKKTALNIGQRQFQLIMNARPR